MQPVVITVFDSEAGTTTDYSFAASPIRIGRNPLNDLTLPFPFVSGWHAVVRFDETVAKFFDLGSTNGTLLNGRRVVAGEPVVVGDMLSLTIGKLELRFHRGGAATQAAPPVSVGATALPTPGRPAGVAAGTIDPDRPAVPVGGTHRPNPAGTAHVQMGDVHQTVSQLRPFYDAYREGWRALFGALNGAFNSMPPPVVAFAMSIVQREFSAVGREAEFAELATRYGVQPTTAPTGAAAIRVPDGGGEIVRRLAESLRPEEQPPRSPQEAERFMSCVEDVLRASAKAFVELQKGQEQFGNEMGVRTIKEFTALHAAGTPEGVLKYLLDWQQGGPHRTQELVGVYADLMIHQVALINGVMEGVRALLARLDPQEIERGVKAGWPTKAAATWKAYADRYRELCQDDKNVTQAVFGAEFARAYAEVGGEGGG